MPMTSSVGVGIGLSFVAMLCWGFGDFLIQKSTRKLGNWETLFVMTAFGAIILLPFVWSRLGEIFTIGMNDQLVLIGAAVILFAAALVDFEALRQGKLAIVEPIWSLEVPMAAFLAYILLGERISLVQMVLIVTLISCLILVGLKEKHIRFSLFLEKGALIAVLGAILMGGANFFMGWGGRVTDPLIINFVTDTFIAVLTGGYLASRGRLKSSFRHVKNNYGVLLPMSIADKVAWLAFVFAMTLAPIAVATALSESYIIIAVLLGLLVNRERLHAHQHLGLIGAIIMAVILAIITSS